MNEIVERINNEIENLECEKERIQLADHSLIQTEKRLKKTGVKLGRLIVEYKNGRNSYYMIDSDGRRNYLKKKADRQIINYIAQKEYNTSLAGWIDKRIETLIAMEREYPQGNIMDVYESLHPARKCVVQPVIKSDEDYAKEWSEKKYITNDYDLPVQTRDTITKKEEIVRSKSEVILANMLYDNGVPYRYEPELILDSGKRVFPDFLCLNKRTRKEFVWEHFGMMDDVDYVCRNISKLREYEQSGYLIGVNLIISYESSSVGFSNKIAQKYIDKFLL